MNALTPAEQENVRAALAVLRRQYTLKELAQAMGIPHRSLTHMVATGRKPTAGVALRVARVAGVSVEDVLSEQFVKVQRRAALYVGGL